MNYPNKFVEYGEYCKICKYKDVKETDEPCNECLSNPTNLNSKRPIKFVRSNKKVGTYSKEEIDEMIKNILASNVKFEDGETFQQKYDSGELKGDRGPQGLPGQDGIDGMNGQDGQDGAKGEKGDPFIFEDFTPEQLESLKGPQGEPGKDGVNGETGPIPLILNATFTTKPDTIMSYSIAPEWLNRDVTVEEQVSGIVTVKEIAYYVTGTIERDSTHIVARFKKVIKLNGENGRNGTDGQNGTNGRDGIDGHTPEKGVDYFTEEDKIQIINSVIDSINENIGSILDDINGEVL